MCVLFIIFILLSTLNTVSSSLFSLICLWLLNRLSWVFSNLDSKELSGAARCFYEMADMSIDSNLTEVFLAVLGAFEASKVSNLS